MKAILILACFALAAIAAPQTLSFEGNVSEINGDSHFKFRFVDMEDSAAGIWWSSISSSASGTSSGTVAGDVDALAGMVMALPTMYQWSWMLYLKGQLSGSISTSLFSSSLSVLATAFMRVEERDASDSVVSTTDLKPLLWHVGTVTKTTTSAGELKSITISATFNSVWTVEMTYILSEVVGQLSYASAIVSPRSLECVIEIKNYPYAATTNHLALVMGVATVDAKVTGNAMVSTSGSSNIYFTLSSQAVIDGTTKDVTIEKYVDGTIDSTIEATVKAFATSSYSAKLVTVNFPAGASTIVYDPAVGQGSKIVYGASAALVPSVIAIAAAAIAMLL